MLLVTLAHTSVDAFFVGDFFGAPSVTGASTLPFVTGFVPVAVLLIVVTRGRLGYDCYLREDPDAAQFAEVAREAARIAGPRD